MEKIKVSDYEQVLATVAKYTVACREGKSDIMKPAFTDNALMSEKCVIPFDLQ